jgi:hypothetical protein
MLAPCLHSNSHLITVTVHEVCVHRFNKAHHTRSAVARLQRSIDNSSTFRTLHIGILISVEVPFHPILNLEASTRPETSCNYKPTFSPTPPSTPCLHACTDFDPPQDNSA